MTYQLCDTPRPIHKNEQEKYCFKTVESANMWQISRPHHLLFGGHKCTVSMPWQMHNTNERWSLFNQIFEISLQFMFLKVLTFSPSDFSVKDFL